LTGVLFISMSALELKVVVIGSVAVGKTSITNRLQFAQFEEAYQPTFGAGYVPWRTRCQGRDVELQIWDTAGMERYRSLGPIYYRDALAAIIVYDQGDTDSADALAKWLEAFRNIVKTAAYIAIVGNKDDLEVKAVAPEPIRAWASENHFDFFLTSAKTGAGVEALFTAVADRLMETPPVLPSSSSARQSSARPPDLKPCC
jgi:small GTP-binding protein